MNVVEAWAAVLREMPAVGKDERMGGGAGGGYNFRSIEAFTGHASILCGKYGVIVVPLGADIEYVDVGKTSNGNVIIEARGRWNWRIYGPQGRDDYIEATTFGQGRDSADKAANKAATAAFKYLLMPALMVSDRKDDPDHDRPETEGHRTPPPAPSAEETALEDHIQAVIQQAKDLKVLDNSGTGPYWKGVVEAAGSSEGAAPGSVLSIVRWVRQDVDAAETLLTDLVRDLKAERARLTEEPVSNPEPPPPPPPRKPRAKPGSAVSAETEAASNVVKGAFPGATEE